MKAWLQSCKTFLLRNKWVLLGAILVTVFVFSNYLLGFKMSFSNVNYSFLPFSTTQTATDGPLLSDIADNHYPTIVRNFYSDEGVSLWESDIALGRSTDTVAEYMNPMDWVYLVPFELAIFLKAFSEFAIGFIAMYLFMRSLGVKKYAASLSATIYIFSGAIVVWLGWSHSDVAVWAPLLFFAIERLMNTLQIKYMFLVSLVVYIMLIVGMPTYAAYFMYLAGVYIVVFTVKRHWKQKRNIFIVGGLFAVGVILAVIASLPYTYTLLENVVGNGYMDTRASYGKATLAWDYLRTLIIPYTRTDLTMHINESTLFIGTLAVALLPFSLCNIKAKKRNLFFVGATVVLVLLIFTGTLNALYTKLPMINTSVKFRVIVLLMFTLSVLTGLTLNDALVNKTYYRKKPWLLAVALVWIGGSVTVLCKDLLEPYTKLVCVLGLLMVVLTACVVWLIIKETKLVYALLACLVVLNSAEFVWRYLPWIDAEAPIVPEPTDSVTYMMENTQEEQRIAGLGTWTLFPNTPSYYDLNDIRTHGFEATNADMKAYYKRIDDQVYLTNTRLVLYDIDNYELLKYMGVKYLYGDAIGDMTPVSGEESHSKAYGPISSGSVLSQNVRFDDEPYMLSILFATYGTEPQSDGDVRIALVSTEGKTVFEEAVPVRSIKDNSYVHLMTGDVTLAPGDYVLQLTFGDLQTDTITVWMKNNDQSVVHGPTGDTSGAIAVFAGYDDSQFRVVHTGEDGLLVAQMNEYADKVELVETLTVCANEDEVLDAMSAQYVDNGAFLVSQDTTLAYNRPLADGEGIAQLQYADDTVTMICSSLTERHLVLNDYYDSDWKAYVNGEEVPVERVNYLMRGIRLPAGENMTVTFRYEPHTLYTVTAVSLTAILLTALLFVFRNKWQALLEKLVVKENVHA